MKKWHYLAGQISDDMVLVNGRWVELNDLGEDGWELAWVLHASEDPYPKDPYPTVWFRREAEQGDV